MGIEVHQPIMDARMLDLNFTNEGGVDGTIRLLRNISGLWLLQESAASGTRRTPAIPGKICWQQAQRAHPFRSILNSDDPAFNTPTSMVDAIRAFCRRTGQPEPAVAR
jgi:rhamnulokinase